MRAVGIREFGGREKLEVLDVPEPKLAPDQVLIRIRAAGVNPVDWKIREGRNEPRFPHIFPVVLGWDAAGVVERVGPSVTEFAAGDEVFTYCRKHFVGDGTYAELISVPATFVARKPRALDFERAAAVPLAALTAYQALFRAAGVTAGESVLIQAAAGGVGSFAVQIAVDAGAEVVGIASERNRDYVLELGAYESIDYGAGDVAAAARELRADGFDAVLDFVGGDALRSVVGAVRDEGRLVSIVEPPTDDVFRERGIEPAYWFVRPDGEELEELADMIDADRLAVNVQEVLPLEEAARAHELSESGHVRGKLVLRVE